MKIKDFCDKDGKEYSIYDNYRSIASAIDGFKPSQRKVIYALLKRGESAGEIKTAQLGSYTALVTCLHYDTEIQLTNGETIKIGDWATKFPNLKLSVFSYDIKNKKFVEAIAQFPIETKKIKKLLEIELDNGEIIKCTEDHKFLVTLENNKVKYIKAKFLKNYNIVSIE